MTSKKYIGFNMKVRDQLDKICTERNVVVFDNFRKLEEAHASLIYKEMGRFFEQSEAYTALLIECYTNLNYLEKTNWKPYMGIQIRILVANVLSIATASDLLRHGHYADSIAITRKAYEGFVTAVWIACHNVEPYGALINAGEGNWIKYDKFFKEGLGLEWKTYKLLSEFSHAGRYPVLAEIVKSQTDPKQNLMVAPRIRYEPQYAELAARLISFDIILLLRCVIHFFEISSALTHEQRKLLKKSKHYYSLREIDFRSVNIDKPSDWPQVLDDLEDIVSLMLSCSEGEQYREAWSNLRTTRSRS